MTTTAAATVRIANNTLLELLRAIDAQGAQTGYTQPYMTDRNKRGLNALAVLGLAVEDAEHSGYRLTAAGRDILRLAGCN